MKVKTDTSLFQVPFGSHLYGTNGPSSDLDFKVVCLPSIDTLLMNIKVTNKKVTPEGVGAGDKMPAGEAEYEYIPLQVFLDDFFNGQTYALEIAFAVLQNKIEFKSKPVQEAVEGQSWCSDIEFIYEWMQELVYRFLTRNISKMVGYAVAQSRNYGLKTERYTALKNVIAKIDSYFESTDSDIDKAIPLSTEFLRTQLLEMPFVEEVMIENANGGSSLAPAFDICGKKFPYTSKWGTIRKSLNSSVAQYGERVKKYDGEGIDWKALSHAIRITEQVIELSQKGTFTFPRTNAKYLKDVKEGLIPLEEALQYLTDCFNRVDEAKDKSILRERTPELEEEFNKFKIRILKEYYF